jgi:hypothetical protein
LGRGSIKVNGHIVDVTIPPTLRRIVPFDYRVMSCMEVLSGMSIRRIVAAADMAAGAAEAQMHPL